jgi:hypothetical protein
MTESIQSHETNIADTQEHLFKKMESAFLISALCDEMSDTLRQNITLRLDHMTAATPDNTSDELSE